MTLVQRTEQFEANRSRMWFPGISTQDRLGSIRPHTMHWGAGWVFIWPPKGRNSNPTFR